MEMNEFSQSVPSDWTEDGVLLKPVRAWSAGKEAAGRAVRDTLLPVATATAIAFCALSASSSRSVDLDEPPMGFVIAAPAPGAYTSSTEGDIDPRVWGRVIRHMQGMRHVEAVRDFENEPEPFI
jgi:hypothetical protein